MSIQDIHTDLLQAAENFASKLAQPDIRPGEAGRYLSALRQTVDILTHQGFNEMQISESSARYFLCSMVKPTTPIDLHRAYIIFCRASSSPVLPFDEFQAVAKTCLEFNGQFYNPKQPPLLLPT